MSSTLKFKKVQVVATPRVATLPHFSFRHFTLPVLFLAFAVCAGSSDPTSGLGSRAVVADPHKPRVVVTTDPELDDSNSLIRYLLYSTDFRTEGLIYASS